jgi:hypothetical protein
MSVGIKKKSTISNNMPEEDLLVFISTNSGHTVPSFDQIRRSKA